MLEVKYWMLKATMGVVTYLLKTWNLNWLQDLLFWKGLLYMAWDSPRSNLLEQPAGIWVWVQIKLHNSCCYILKCDQRSQEQWIYCQWYGVEVSPMHYCVCWLPYHWTFGCIEGAYLYSSLGGVSVIPGHCGPVFQAHYWEQLHIISLTVQLTAENDRQYYITKTFSFVSKCFVFFVNKSFSYF
jgi:hypothetical protein